MKPDLCNAAELAAKSMRENLKPPPLVAPGTELRHIVTELFLLREAVRLLADDVAALLLRRDK